MISHIVFPFNFLLQRLEDRIADVRNRTDAVDLTVLRHVGFAGRCELAVVVDECFGLSMVDRQTLHHDFFAVIVTLYEVFSRHVVLAGNLGRVVLDVVAAARSGVHAAADIRSTISESGTAISSTKSIGTPASCRA